MEVSKRAQSIKASSTLAISAKAAELKAQGKDMVTFGVGEPDFDTPAHIREAAKKAIDEGKTRYTPAAGTPALRKAVCDKLKKDNDLGTVLGFGAIGKTICTALGVQAQLDGQDLSAKIFD